MKYAKIVSVLAVLLMVFSCSACVLANESTATAIYGDTNPLEDKGTVTLDPTKEFSDNQTELAKLGLGQESWTKTSTKTTLTLTDVNYETEESIAIYVNTTGGSAIDFEIIVKGDNSIVSGNKTSSAGIDDYGGMIIETNCKSVTFTGDGKLVVGNDGLATKGYNAGISNISSNDSDYPPLTIKGCTIIAFGGDVFEDKTLASTPGSYDSYGILSDGDLTITDGAKVYAKSGSVYTYSTPELSYEVGGTKALAVYAVMSAGIATMGDLVVKDSTIVGTGGTIGSEYVVQWGIHTKVILKVISTGVFIAGETELTNSEVYGYGGDSNGKDNSLGQGGVQYKQSESVGIYYRADFTANKSSIYGYAGDAHSNALSYSAGIGYFYAPAGGEKIKFTINDGYIYGEGGIAWATVAKEPWEQIECVSMGFGAVCETWKDTSEDICFDLFFNKSIANFFGNEDTINSNGIYIIKWKYSEAIPVAIGSISLDNSELYAIGHTKAIAVTGNQDNIIRIGTATPLFCAGSKTVFDPEFKTFTDPDDLVKDGILRCGIGFNYNVFLISNFSEYSEVDALASKDGTYALPECSFEAPEGMVFIGWLIDGEIYEPGDAVDLTKGPVIAYAMWNVDTSVELEITSPTEDTKVTSDKIDVSGKTDGDNITILVNGKDVGKVSIGEDGKFSTTVSLEKGNNSIVIKATNSLGGETQKTINVTYDAGGGTSNNNNNDVWMWVSIVLIIILIAGVIAFIVYYKKLL